MEQEGRCIAKGDGCTWLTSIGISVSISRQELDTDEFGLSRDEPRGYEEVTADVRFIGTARRDGAAATDPEPLVRRR